MVRVFQQNSRRRTDFTNDPRRRFSTRSLLQIGSMRGKYMDLLVMVILDINVFVRGLVQGIKGVEAHGRIICILL